MSAESAILLSCPLFAGITEEELPAMVRCLNGRNVEFQKGETIFLEGDTADFLGVVLSGEVQIVRDDYNGNRSVISAAQAGGLFGEAFSCAELKSLPVSVIAQKSSTVMLLDCKRVLTVCPNACKFYSRMINNLLRVVARKNLMLSKKIQLMSRKTTKEKLLAYLYDCAKQFHTREFRIPYDRQALADYLGVERSAMSAEISKLKRAGIIACKGSFFTIMSDSAEYR